MVRCVWFAFKASQCEVCLQALSTRGCSQLNGFWRLQGCFQPPGNENMICMLHFSNKGKSRVSSPSRAFVDMFNYYKYNNIIQYFPGRKHHNFLNIFVLSIHYSFLKIRPCQILATQYANSNKQ